MGKEDKASESSPLYLIGLGILVPSLCGIAVIYKSPQTLIKYALRLQMRKCGMKQRYVSQGSKKFSYGEKNSPVPGKPSLVFVHGFTSTKLQWLSAFKGLRTHCHMIALDWPGHGNSSFPAENQTIDPDYMDATMLLFLQLAGLSGQKVHLVGASLGGAIVGVFSALHPDKVDRVTMICPAMNTPIQSEFLKTLKQTMKKDHDKITYADCALLPQEISGLRKMFNLCTYDKVSIDMHDKVYEGLLNLRLPKSPFFLKMFKSTNTEENLNLLPKLAPSIVVPSQIIWGKHDEIIDPSGARYLKELLPNCKSLHELEYCGHAVDVDRSGALCKYLEQFILDRNTPSETEKHKKEI